jgi:YHS domain-containing protein
MSRLLLFLFALFLFLTVLRGLRIFFAAVFRPHGASGAARQGGTREAEMVRDPVCGTWIDRTIAVLGRKGAETMPVCSEECRRRLEATP